MPTQVRSFKVLILAFFYLVILLSSCAVADTSPVTSRSRAVADTSFVYHRISSVGTTLLTYSKHLNAVSAVAWSPDGTRIASGDDDGIVRIWQAPLACQCVTGKSSAT